MQNQELMQQYKYRKTVLEFTLLLSYSLLIALCTTTSLSTENINVKASRQEVSAEFVVHTPQPKRNNVNKKRSRKEIKQRKKKTKREIKRQLRSLKNKLKKDSSKEYEEKVVTSILVVGAGVGLGLFMWANGITSCLFICTVMPAYVLGLWLLILCLIFIALNYIWKEEKQD